MIELFEGRIGGGKTYNAVVRMVAQIARGGTICTNVDIIWPAIQAYVAKRWGIMAEEGQCIKLADEDIFLFHRFTPSGTAAMPVLVVIDEAHLHFNARDHATTDKLFRETLTFLTQSRKVNTDIIFISQSILNMDRQFGRLVQFIWRFRDMAKWKIPGLGIGYPFKQILCAQYDYDGKTMLNRAFIRKDPAIFALYDTNAIVRPFVRLEDVVTNRKLQSVVKPKRAMAKYLIPISIAIGLLAAWFLFSNPPGSVPQAKTAAPVATPSTVAKGKDKDKSSDDTAYDIYDEHFQAWNGLDRALKTSESGWFQVGEMSTRGFVLAVQERRAKVAQPNGRPAWIVATRDYIPPSIKQSTSHASPSPSAAPTVDSSLAELSAIPVATPIPSPTRFPISKVR